jgi:hypothetical protein
MHAFNLVFAWLWLATRRDAAVAGLLGLFCRPRSTVCMRLVHARMHGPAWLGCTHPLVTQQPCRLCQVRIHPAWPHGQSRWSARHMLTHTLPCCHAFGTQRSGDIVDASIRVECGSAPQVLDRDVAESIALFKTGHDRHRHTFLGVYRLTTRRSEGKPVYQVRLARFDFFTVFHKPNYLFDKTLPCRAVVDQHMSHSRVWCPILLDSGAFAPSRHVRSAPHTTC